MFRHAFAGLVEFLILLALAGCGGGGGGDGGVSAGMTDAGAPSALGGGGAGGGGTVTTSEAASSSDGVAIGAPAPAAPVAATAMSPFGPVTVGTATAEEVAVSRLVGGGSVAAWQSGQELHARILDPSGTPSGTTLRVNVGPRLATPPIAFDVAGLADGGFVVVWAAATSEALTANANTITLQARTYTADRQQRGGESLVSQNAMNTIGAGKNLVVEGAPDGGWAVAWTGKPSRIALSGAFLQRFAPDNSYAGPIVDVTAAGSDVVDLTMTALADGSMVVGTVQASTPSDQAFTAYLQRIGANGQVLLSAQRFLSNSEAFSFSVDALASGNVAAAWSSGTSSSGYSVKWQVLTADAAPVSAAGEILWGPPVEDVRVASLGQSGFGVAWQVIRGFNRGESTSMHVQLLDAAGVTVGAPQEFARTTGTVSPTTGASATAGSGYDIDAGPDGHWVAAFQAVQTLGEPAVAQVLGR